MSEPAETTPCWDGHPPLPQEEGWCLLSNAADEREEAWYWAPTEGAYFADGATTKCAYLLPGDIAVNGWRLIGRLMLQTGALNAHS